MGKIDTKDIKYCMRYQKCILCPKFNICFKVGRNEKYNQHNDKRVQNKRTRL